jgi:hypothetical protein
MVIVHGQADLPQVVVAARTPGRVPHPTDAVEQQPARHQQDQSQNTQVTNPHGYLDPSRFNIFNKLRMHDALAAAFFHTGRWRQPDLAIRPTL